MRAEIRKDIIREYIKGEDEEEFPLLIVLLFQYTTFENTQLTLTCKSRERMGDTRKLGLELKDHPPRRARRGKEQMTELN